MSYLPQCVMVGCLISLIVEASYLSNCSACTPSVTSFSITAIVYSVIMIFVHLWFLWGVKNVTYFIPLKLFYIFIEASNLALESCNGLSPTFNGFFFQKRGVTKEL